ncbi:HAMP domain-containing protein [Trichormus variabilis ARAD]|uniref:histidine kinase n=1 Tax=Trichormus variabilis N2B TaxID=2681315 RepID=A0ABR6SDZ0_ANAVA|nr:MULTISPECIES: ATP-binding protein [Nostocaceae]MBC1216732.1 HAMP domain-containing protein [Trichormus variabilis ARAD]MBC1258448.1 HAMP domain-containing protein [Trichormus variabilis V5]MBC1304479.1 HAMP domain-containing protein [Trichormus variabilis N2B]MBC1312923.1 HAMP domain-containing protein [Trichormus variabilis PNB]MBC1328781.1 HAMP domain-containing protein [Trichormus variabilis 9RC]
MPSNGQSSFRRILVTRILLLFVPVLFVGQIAALNKARSSLLKTARQNLTESAVIRGERILNAIATLKTNLLTASRTTVVQSGSPEEIEAFLTQLVQALPNYIECLQLINWQNGEIVASSCGKKEITQFGPLLPSDSVELRSIAPPKPGVTGPRNPQEQLQLLLTAPVYDKSGKLRYALNLQSALYKQTRNQPGSLTGSTIVIAEDGTILAHPLSDLVGTNIKEHSDAKQVQNIIKNAIAGRNEPINLIFNNKKELVAGYTVIDSPTTIQPQQKWIVMSVTTVENALFGLEEIKLILIVLTVGLIGASLVASLYLAPYLASPVEELRDYALNIHSHHTSRRVPDNFKIREFNQLAQAIDQMVDRLKVWSEEIETAWKDAKSANQVKSQFLATTSHELRNPLNIIINCVRLVKDGLCDNREEEIEFLQRADETAIHLLGIINELLDISKIEAGKLSVVSQPLDLRQTLLEVINLQSVNVQQKGLQLKTNLGTEPIPVKADAAKLKQVLINIIGNATKFTDEGGISIATTIQTRIDGKSQVMVSITDTGLGIEPAQQHKLFRPFVMVNGSTTRKFEGTGLGLAISRNLIELMGGTITLESAGINQGTTVNITLPLIDISLLGLSATDNNKNQKNSEGDEEIKGTDSFSSNHPEAIPLDCNENYGSKKTELEEYTDLERVNLFVIHNS